MEQVDAAPQTEQPTEARRTKRRGLTRRGFLRTVCYGGLAVPPAYGFFCERHWLQVERIELSLPRLPAAFDGFTLVQLSDPHFGRKVSPAHIRRAVDLTQSLQPDAIVLTGDYATRLGGGEAELIVQELGRLSAPEGVWAVLGNHDHWTDAEVIAEALIRAGIHPLLNAHTSFARQGARLWLAGVDDVVTHFHNLPRAMSGVPDDAAVILLAHEPDFADEAARDPRIVLQLSGHSHGGQICLPYLTRFALPRLARKYPRGLRQVGNLWLYTNRGLGTIVLPLRINCRPEVTLITLTVPQEGRA